MGERILQAIQAEGKSLSQTERDCGFGRGNLNRIVYGERGNQSVNVERMVVLAKYLHVSLEWLLTGSGTMRRASAHEAPRAALSEGQREALRAYLLDQLEALDPGVHDRLRQQTDVVVSRQHGRKKK